MSFDYFHFLRPYWLALLPLVLIGYFIYFKGLKNKSSWEKVVDKKFLKLLLIKGSSRVRHMVVYLMGLAFILAVLSLSGPTWKRKELPHLTVDNAVAVLLNLSTEMDSSDVSPSRLTRAKYKIMDILDSVPDAQSGMIVYGAEPFLVSPLSDDPEIIKNLLPAIATDIMPATGDRADRAIAMAADKLRASGFKLGNIVIFTGGIETGFNQALKEAKIARERGYRVSVVNVSPASNEKLKLLAEAGGGVLSNIQSSDSSVVSLINSTAKEELKKSVNLIAAWEDFGYYLLFVPLLICLYFFRRGILILILAAMPLKAHAGFLLNQNQDAWRDFNNRRFKEAAAKFEDAKWKASSYYRAKDYAKAYEEFSKDTDVESLYNQGNSLAKQGKINEAIKKYEEVLKEDAKHEDAAFNLEYLKQKQQEEQEKQQQQQEQQQTSENKEASSGQSSENQTQNGQKQEQQSSAESQNNQEQQPKRETGSSSPDKPNKKPSKSFASTKSNNEKFDEEVQAREMLYREVPEDPGGLLRALINKEYARKRYD